MRSRMSQPNRTPQLRICSLSIPALGSEWTICSLLIRRPKIESLPWSNLQLRWACFAHFDIRCGDAKANPSCLFGFAYLLGRLLCRLRRLLCNAEVFEPF